MAMEQGLHLVWRQGLHQTGFDFHMVLTHVVQPQFMEGIRACATGSIIS